MDELLEIIKAKKYNAELDLDLAEMFMDKDKKKELKGEINAYTDLICLIESKKG